MKTVKVTASRAYEVKIGSGLLASLGKETAALVKGRTAAIVSDSTVWPLFGGVCAESLEQAGFSTVHFVFPSGESSKNGTVFLELLNFLAENKLTRSDCVIALGGGVVGDLSGFAAACYLRGVAYIQVPTTLLAAVDSSVGGKTAIDLPAGKNLAGAFYQPRLVLCDTDCLAALPEEIFRDGCAEVIKYGILYDPDLFAGLLDRGMDFDREAVIARCVELKRDVVSRDEFDLGLRMKLNLGHTVGHGVEAHSGYTIPHGRAVAIGTAIVARAACRYGYCTRQTRERILRCLNRFGLPTHTDFTARQLFESALSDKKRSGGTVHLIVPRSIGDCEILPTKVEELEAFIEAGLVL